MAHNSKPKPMLSDEAMARKVIVPHNGRASVGHDFSDPDTRLQYPNPGAGSGADSDGGPPSTGDKLEMGWV
jgi:hypothetical protein